MWFVDHLAAPIMAVVLLWELLTVLFWLKLRNDQRTQLKPGLAIGLNGLCWLMGLSICYLIWILLNQLPLQSDVNVRQWAVILQFTTLAGSLGALSASFAFKAAKFMLRIKLLAAAPEKPQTVNHSMVNQGFR